ncbi:MAG: COX15/CtaA family protein [Pseudomonadota bacterium]
MSALRFGPKTDCIVTLWLWGVFLTLLAMIVLGGATRLTHAGLSIAEWKPISGIIPPLSLADWMLEFESYQKTPEYLLVNMGMSLSDFKSIFWMEYSHRLLGRLIGFYILLPMIIFWTQGKLNTHLKITSVLLLLLIGFQGFLGWYMVKSGLLQDPAVSPFRLSIHLLMAFLLISLTLNAIYHLNAIPHDLIEGRPSGWSIFNLFLLILTVFYGALVAGHKAGHIYNTFPLMEGQWLPSEWNHLKPLWLNFFENHATVQFIHRQLAYLVFISACIGVFKRLITPWYGIAVLGQLLLGIFTLLYSVPLSLGTLHQGWSVIVFSMAFWCCRTQKSAEKSIF